MSLPRLIPLVALVAVDLVSARARACTFDTDCGHDMVCETDTVQVCTTPTPPAHDPLCSYNPTTKCVPKTLPPCDGAAGCGGGGAPDGGAEVTPEQAPRADAGSDAVGEEDTASPPRGNGDGTGDADPGPDGGTASAASSGGCNVAGRANGTPVSLLVLSGLGVVGIAFAVRRKARVPAPGPRKR